MSTIFHRLRVMVAKVAVVTCNIRLCRLYFLLCFETSMHLQIIPAATFLSPFYLAGRTVVYLKQHRVKKAELAQHNRDTKR